jgi:hypothetical protein
MKRSLGIFLLIAYTATTLGIGFQLHFCGKKISSVNLIISDLHLCDCGTAEMKPDCCKNEIKYIKLKTAHGKSASQHIPVLTFTADQFYPVAQKFSSVPQPVQVSFFRPPPNTSQPPLYKLNGNFLI